MIGTILQASLFLLLAWGLMRQLRPPIRDLPWPRRAAMAIGWASLAAFFVAGYWERSGVTLVVGVVLAIASGFLQLRSRG